MTPIRASNASPTYHGLQIHAEMLDDFKNHEIAIDRNLFYSVLKKRGDCQFNPWEQVIRKIALDLVSGPRTWLFSRNIPGLV